jgi:hypothetical protein
MKSTLALGLLVAMVAVLAPAAHADSHGLVTEPPGVAAGEPPSSLDIDLKLGLRSFRFGSRVFGRQGYAGGAWLNGETRPDGFSLDGRVEHGGKARNFKLNADVDEWVRRAVRWWSVTDL